MVQGPESLDTLTVRCALASSLSRKGKNTEAEAMERQVLEAQERGIMM